MPSTSQPKEPIPTRCVCSGRSIKILKSHKYEAESLKAKWLEIVKQNGMSLQDAPKELRDDHDVVLTAVSEYGEKDSDV